MPKQRLKQLEIAHRRRQVAELTLRGYSQAAIAEQLGAAQSTVCADLTVIEGEWRTSAIRDFDLARARELLKLDRVEREASDAWERLQQPIETDRVTQEGSTKRIEKRIVHQHGDPRYLDVVGKCIAQRRGLLGLDTTGALEARNDELSPDLRGDRFLAVLGWATPAPASGSS